MSNTIEDYLLDDHFHPDSCEFDEDLLDFEDETIIVSPPEMDWLLPRETITTAERLERFPEMYHIPARRHKSVPSDVPNSEATKFIKVYDPFKKMEAVLEKVLVCCPECNSWFKSRHIMENHKVQHSNKNREIRLPTFICPYEDCPIRCDCQDTLNLHVKHHHDRPDVEYEELQFPDWSSFENWREDHEHGTSTRFVHFSGKSTPYGRNSRMGCFFTRPFTNNTSLSTSSMSTASSEALENRVRQSKKLDRACTAHMSVRECYGRIHVRACLTHCGHEGLIHMHNLPLSRRIKNEIATALMKGHCEAEILKSYSESCPPSDRRFYVRPYEIRNVLRKLIQNQHREWLISETPLISNMKTEDEEVPIIFDEFPPPAVKEEEVPMIFEEFPPSAVKTEEIPIIYEEFPPPAVKEEEVITEY